MPGLLSRYDPNLLPDFELLLRFGSYPESSAGVRVYSRGSGVLSSWQEHDGGTSVVTRILLVDDDPHLVPLLQRGLSFEGFEVYTAMDGESGLVAVQKHQPHLVLLDIAMPGSDGFEICRRLRLQDDIAIIMLTARDEVPDKVSALNLGADDYIPKPFAFDELVARIRAVLRRPGTQSSHARGTTSRAPGGVDLPGVQALITLHASPQASANSRANPGACLGLQYRDR